MPGWYLLVIAPTRAEVKNTLRLSIESVRSIDEAVELLTEIAEPVGV